MHPSGLIRHARDLQSPLSRLGADELVLSAGGDRIRYPVIGKEPCRCGIAGGRHPHRGLPAMFDQIVREENLMDSQELGELEAVIERGRQTFVEVGRALTDIRDRRGYRLFRIDVI